MKKVKTVIEILKIVVKVLVAIITLFLAVDANRIAQNNAYFSLDGERSIALISEKNDYYRDESDLLDLTINIPIRSGSIKDGYFFVEADNGGFSKIRLDSSNKGDICSRIPFFGSLSSFPSFGLFKFSTIFKTCEITPIQILHDEGIRYSVPAWYFLFVDNNDSIHIICYFPIIDNESQSIVEQIIILESDMFSDTKLIEWNNKREEMITKLGIENFSKQFQIEHGITKNALEKNRKDVIEVYRDFWR